jgi:hypothetical protein
VGEDHNSDHVEASASACLPTDTARGVEEALRLAEVGEYLLERCAVAYGDGQLDPRELTIAWEWQQTKPGEYGRGVLLAETTAWHEAQRADGFETEAYKLRAALTSPPSVGGGNQGISSELTATSSGAVLAQGDFAIDRAWIDGARYARNCLEADNHQKLNDAIDGRQKEISAALAAANGPNGATAPPPDHGQLSQQNQSPPLPKEPGR